MRKRDYYNPDQLLLNLLTISSHVIAFFKIINLDIFYFTIFHYTSTVFCSYMCFWPSRKASSQAWMLCASLFRKRVCFCGSRMYWSSCDEGVEQLNSSSSSVHIWCWNDSSILVQCCHWYAFPRPRRTNKSFFCIYEQVKWRVLPLSRNVKRFECRLPLVLR